MLKIAQKKALKLELEKNNCNIQAALSSLRIVSDVSVMKEVNHLTKQWGFTKKPVV
jgi:hypothetical protein